MSRKGNQIKVSTVLWAMLAVIALLVLLSLHDGGGASYDDFDEPSYTFSGAPDVPIGGGSPQPEPEGDGSAKEQTVREMDERLNRAYDLQDIE